MNLGCDEKLNLNGPWSLGKVAFEWIIEQMNRLKSPKRIVEFGSGPSSIRLALAFPETSVLSIEGNRQSFHQTKALAEEFGTANLILRYRPLKFQCYGFGQLLSYEEDPVFEDFLVDGVIVDGPPFYTLRGREACLYQIYSKLRLGGIVILDDYRRSHEKQIVKNWLSVYPDSFSMEVFMEGHQLVVLQKQREVEPNWTESSRCQDNLLVNENYARIKSALLHLDDEFIELMLNKGARDLFYAIRDAYQVSVEQIEATCAIDAKLVPEERMRLQKKYFNTVVQIIS